MTAPSEDNAGAGMQHANPHGSPEGVKVSGGVTQYEVQKASVSDRIF
jgi:hypothetical protein